MRIIYAIIAGLAWGVACGYLRGAHLLILVGALASTALGFWLERVTLTASAPADKLKRTLMIAAAYAFVALIALAASGAAYGGGEWLSHH